MNEEVRRMNPGAEFYTPERCHINELSNMAADPDASIARARVRSGVTTRWHRVNGTTERYVILEGAGRVEVGSLPPQEVGPGDVVLIPPSCRQRITSLGGEDLIFLAICTPRFRPEAYEDIDVEPMPRSRQVDNSSVSRKPPRTEEAMEPMKDASHFYEVERRQYHAERPGFRINELQISPTQQVPWHYHSNIQDTFYVLEGELRLFLREPKEEVRLGPGETYSVPPRRSHLVTNAGATSATFLVLQGIGEYDFVPLVPKRSRSG